MSRKNKIFVKDMGNGLSTLWNPYKTIHQMRMEDDNPHLSFLENILNINNYIGTPGHNEMLKKWVNQRCFTTKKTDDGKEYGIIYDMKVKIINNKVICKNLFTMYLNEEETKDEIEFSQTQVKVSKQIPVKDLGK